MIKTTILSYYSPTSRFNHFKTFRQYTADNGRSLYAVGNRIVTKEEGNKEFLDTIKKAKKHEVEEVTAEADNAAILKSLNDSIDKYVEFIDNYRQYRAACDANNEIRSIIREFEKIAKD